MSRGDLTEVEWRILRVLLPVEREPGKRGRGRPPEDNCNVINGILWRLRTGAPWRDVPEKYGNWNSIYRVFGDGAPAVFGGASPSLWLKRCPRAVTTTSTAPQFAPDPIFAAIDRHRAQRAMLWNNIHPSDGRGLW